MVYEIKAKDGSIAKVGNIVGPVVVVLGGDYQDRVNGPSLKQFEGAIRRELSSLLEQNHPIIFME